MYGFSAVDGFVEVNDSVGEMIKYLANEPSVGLYFVQQHTENAVPNLVNIKDKLVKKSHEVVLHTEDLEDSISAMSSMKACGFPIADEMIKDIKKSLLIMSTSQPKRGLITKQSSGFHLGRSSSRRPATFNYNIGTAKEESSSGSYFSTVLNSAKQRAAAIRWSQLDAPRPRNPTAKNLSSTRTKRVSVTSSSTDVEVEELPLSSPSHIEEEQLDEPATVGTSLPTHDLLLKPENYEKLKSEQVAKLEEWLGEGKNF